MIKTRHEKRQQAMIYLYQTLLREDIGIALDKDSSLEVDQEFQKALIYVLKEKDDLIQLINDELIEWTFDRLGFIEQSILLSACGNAVILSTPKTALINEAVELSKTFGDQDETYKLVNATLDKVLNI